MSETWSAEWVKRVLGAAWVRRPARGAGPVRGVSTDTRSLREGEAFVALRGERFDGHNFLHAAVQRGAAMLVVDRPIEPSSADGRTPAVVRVGDTRRALGLLAHEHRSTIEGLRVVGVTGSAGKTTTVRMIDAVLRTSLRGTSSPRSYNNEVGVPLTVLGARSGDQFLVCEAGMNAPGELAYLSHVLEPDIAVITSIGRAHIGAFAHADEIAREKASLLTHLRPNGIGVCTADSPALADYLRPVANLVLFGDAGHADLRLTECRSLMLDDGTPGVEGCVNGRLRFTLRMPGRHNALNALAAIAVGRRFGVPEEDAVEALAALPGPEMRMERVAEGGVTIFNDAYNASPESMRAALATFAELEPDPGRRVLVLGDMLELGSHGDQLHREIAGFIAEACPARRVVTIGPLSLVIAEALERLMPDAEIRMHSELTDPLAARIAMRFREGESVLVKGSRRIGLERVVTAWRDHARGLARTGPA